jgi:hypothetical protein
MRRVLIKEILRQAFRSIPSQIYQEYQSFDSVHGEFGPAEKWETIRPHIGLFIMSQAGKDVIDDIGRCLMFGTQWTEDGISLKRVFEEMQHYIQCELLTTIDSIVADERYTQKALSERLASAGILPMFGFPTRIRLLFTDIPFRSYPWPPERDTVDRDLDIAISQFAPGSETVKDKRCIDQPGYWTLLLLVTKSK